MNQCNVIYLFIYLFFFFCEGGVIQKNILWKSSNIEDHIWIEVCHQVHNLILCTANSFFLFVTPKKMSSILLISD